MKTVNLRTTFLLLLVLACSSTFVHASKDVVDAVASTVSAETNEARPQEQQPRRQLFWSLVFLGTLVGNKSSCSLVSCLVYKVLLAHAILRFGLCNEQPIC
jgi:hypothetical protein